MGGCRVQVSRNVERALYPVAEMVQGRSIAYAPFRGRQIRLGAALHLARNMARSAERNHIRGMAYEAV